MNAGRELDALVAEKVMAWSKGPNGTVVCNREIRQAEVASMLNTESYPACSTDISAAWEVVEKFLDKGGEFNIFINGDRYDMAFYNERDDAISAKGETAPHAICLAALKAVELK